MVRQMETGKKRLQTAYWSLVGMASALLIETFPNPQLSWGDSWTQGAINVVP